MNWLATLEARVDESPVARLLDRAKQPIPRFVPAAGIWNTGDIVVAVLLGVVAAIVAYLAMGLLPTTLYDSQNGDVWFQADLPRALMAMGDRVSDAHYRNTVHPLWSILIFPPVALLRLAGLSAVEALQTLVLAATVATTAVLYFCCRTLGIGRFVSVLFGLLFISSSTFLYWFSVAESYPFSALSLLTTTLIFMRLNPARRSGFILGGLVSLSITVTNWTLGLAQSFLALRLGRFLTVSIATLLVAMSLCVVQRVVFPHAGIFFLPKAVVGELSFTQVKTVAAVGGHTVTTDIQWTPLDNLRTILVSSAVAPKPYIGQALDPASASGTRPILSNQVLKPGAYGPVEGAAALTWVALLLFSLVAIWRDRLMSNILLGCLLYTAGQLLLYLIYGDMTFLFASNLFPILLLIVAHAARTRWARPHAALLGLSLALALAANPANFIETAHRATQLVAGNAS